MKIADDGTLEPWLAESATNVNATTWEMRDQGCGLLLQRQEV